MRVYLIMRESFNVIDGGEITVFSIQSTKERALKLLNSVAKRFGSAWIEPWDVDCEDLELIK